MTVLIMANANTNLFHSNNDSVSVVEDDSSYIAIASFVQVINGISLCVESYRYKDTTYIMMCHGRSFTKNL